MSHRLSMRRLVATLSVIALSCVLVGLIGVVLRPPSFPTRRQAIAYVLTQRGIAYDQVFINQTWPDTVNSVVYGANLIIITRDQGEVPGRIECRTADRDCYISVDRLGVDRATIPDITIQRDHPALAWLEAQVAIVRARAGRSP